MSELRLPGGRISRGLPERVTVEGPGLVRNRDMVHRRWCYRVRGREIIAWAWPVGKTKDEIAAAAENGLKFCRSCKPLDHIPGDVDGRDT